MVRYWAWDGATGRGVVLRGLARDNEACHPGMVLGSSIWRCALGMCCWVLRREAVWCCEAWYGAVRLGMVL